MSERKTRKENFHGYFSGEFLMNEKNQQILKFYTGTYAAYS